MRKNILVIYLIPALIDIPGGVVVHPQHGGQTGRDAVCLLIKFCHVIELAKQKINTIKINSKKNNL